jgi:hypothetical protein
MSPRTKSIVLILSLALPYGAFVSFFVFSATPGSTHPFPSWVAWVAIAYMLGSMLLTSILGPKLFRGAPSPPPTPRNRVYMQTAKGWSLYLVLVWSCIFIYGAYKTLKSDLLLERAIPAGAALLAFIAIFAQSIRRMYAAENQVQPYPPPYLPHPADSSNPARTPQAASAHDRKLLIVLAVLAAILVLLAHL